MSPTTCKSLSSQQIDQAVGHQIRTRRQAAEMTQAALGEAIGVTFQQVQKYEAGRNRVSVAMIVEIATALNCPVLDLLGGVLPKSHGPGPQRSAVGAVRHLTDMYQELSPGSRALVAKLVRTLHEQEAGQPSVVGRAPMSAGGDELG